MLSKCFWTASCQTTAPVELHNSGEAQYREYDDDQADNVNDIAHDGCPFPEERRSPLLRTLTLRRRLGSCQTANFPKTFRETA